MQVFEEDLGVQFDSFARESWKLVLHFILTELKRGFTYCLKERAGIPHAGISGSRCQANNTFLSVFDLTSCDNFGTVSDCRDDVRNDVSGDDAADDACTIASQLVTNARSDAICNRASDVRNDVAPSHLYVGNDAKCSSCQQTETQDNNIIEEVSID